MPKKNTVKVKKKKLVRPLKDVEIEEELHRMMSSDDEEGDDDDVEYPLYSERPTLFNNLDAKLNKIQSYSYKDILYMLEDGPAEATVDHMLPSAKASPSCQPRSPAQPPPSPAMEIEVDDKNGVPVPEVDAAVDEPMSSPAPQEEVCLESVCEEPRASHVLEVPPRGPSCQPPLPAQPPSPAQPPLPAQPPPSPAMEIEVDYANGVPVPEFDEPLSSPTPQEEVCSESVSEEPRAPPVPEVPPRRPNQAKFRSGSDYFELLRKNREWSNDLSRYSPPPNFKRPLTVNKEYNNRSTPLTYFQDMFPTELICLIVRNTNIYAAHKSSKHWKDTTAEEMNAYLGIMVLMSINPVPDIKINWSTDEFYRNNLISNVMPFKRFQKITENLHVNNILEEVPRENSNFDKLCKVRPIVDTLNEAFQQNCSSSQHQSIDESMIKFKGKSSMKQYMPKKPIKRGYKCWCRCDSKTGYLYEFQIYTGKVDNTAEEGLGCRVILDLCQNVPPVFDNFFIVTFIVFDKFFTNLPLLEILHSEKIYAVGTIRVFRKGLPTEIAKRNNDLKLAPGEFIYKYSYLIACIKWMDTKDVLVASTAHNPKSVEVIQRTQKNGSKKAMFCPTAIKKYTDHMGGVDIFDHYRSSYPLSRKSRKYWHRLFWFLFEAAMVNAYIAYHQTSLMTHRDFRLRIGRLLINNYSSKKKTVAIFKNKKGGIYGVPDEIRLVNVGVHIPQDNFKFRRCRFCSTRVKEKRSRYICKTCKVHICIECFDNFHK